MKLLKNILIILLVIVIIAVVGAIIFIKTLDVNKFKPQITQELKKALGRDVDLDAISLTVSLKQGVALQLKNFGIAEDIQFGNEKFVSIQAVYLNVDVMEYFRNKTVSVSKLSVDNPRINLIRDEKGVFNFQSIIENVSQASATSQPGSTQGPPSSNASQSSAALPLILVKSIELNNGGLFYQDKMLGTLMTIPVKDLDILIKDFSLDKPFILEAKANVFSKLQNIVSQGQMEIHLADQTIQIDRLSVNSDLTQLSLEQLKQAIAALAPVNFEGGLKGKITVSIDQLKAGSAGILNLNANAHLTGGEVKLKEIYSPLTQMSADVDINERDINIKNFSADFSEGRITFQGRLDDYLKTKKPTFNLITAGVSPAGIIDPAVLPAKVEGVIASQISGEAQGISPELLKSSLNGKGEFALLEGKIKDFNLLKIILEKLSAVPIIGGLNLEQELESRLPAKYKESLQMKDTIIDDLKSTFQLGNGALQFNDLSFKASGIAVGLNGQIDLDQNIIVDGNVILDKELSSGLVSINNAFVYLQNDDKEISFPLTRYQGKLAQIEIYPDLKDFATNAIINKGKEELKNVIFKALDIETKTNPEAGNAPDSKQGAQPASNQPEASPEQKAIEGLINQIPIFRKQ